MSSVSDIGGVGNDPLQALRQLRAQDQALATDRPRQAPPQDGEGPAPLWNDIEASAETAGLSEDQLTALKADLKDAITSAMESVAASDDPEAGHAAVDNAILTTLQEYGLDTEELESHMEEAKNRMQGMQPPGPPPSAGGSQGGGGSPGLSATSAGSQDPASALLSTLFPLIDDEA